MMRRFAKFVLLTLILTALGITETPAIEQENKDRSNTEETRVPDNSPQQKHHLDVRPGPFETQRKKLLEEIYAAEKSGVGIKTYLMAFDYIEQMVKLKSPEQEILRRMRALDDGLFSQIAPLEYKRLRTKDTLTFEEARDYVVSLINADRAKFKLQPVVLDPVASKAGQAHTDEMASSGYCAHWDLSGKKHWQRYSEAGGTHSVGENAALFGNAKSAKDNTFSAALLEEIQIAFMRERPPDDGHRLQILRPDHNKVGIGLSQRLESNFTSLALTQEFVDDYGDHKELPTRIARGKPFEVSGRLRPGLTLRSIGIYYEPAPKPMTKEQLSKTHSCRFSANFVTEFYPDPALKEIKVWTKDGKLNYSVFVTPQKDWKDGLYYVQVQVRKANTDETIIASMTTTLLGSKVKTGSSR